MRVAVEGCCHGELDKIYETIEFLESRDNNKVDLLLICGDFQAVRNRADLQCMAVPDKFKKLNTFYKYYSGEKTAPLLTVIIGGNHEASNFFQELPYGGWIAPNMYYMGYAGIINVGGLRIGGVSGIYKSNDYHTGHHERLPYSASSIRSIYHVRSLEVFRLKQLKQHVDVFLSHDWPRGIYYHGNVNQLIRKKRFFEDEIADNTLGSPPNEDLLYKLRPSYWFSAHLHVKFSALVEHQAKDTEPKAVTKFLALDKCLPNRGFLQVLDMPSKEGEPIAIKLDAEWLSILQSTDHLLHTGRFARYMPSLGSSERFDFTPTEKELADTAELFGDDLTLPKNFEKTAPIHSSDNRQQNQMPQYHTNPQTALLCEVLGIRNPTAEAAGLVPTPRVEAGSLPGGVRAQMPASASSIVNANESVNPDEIDLDGDDDDSDDDDGDGDNVNSKSCKGRQADDTVSSQLSTKANQGDESCAILEQSTDTIDDYSINASAIITPKAYRKRDGVLDTHQCNDSTFSGDDALATPASSQLVMPRPVARSLSGLVLPPPVLNIGKLPDNVTILATSETVTDVGDTEQSGIGKGGESVPNVAPVEEEAIKTMETESSELLSHTLEQQSVSSAESNQSEVQCPPAKRKFKRRNVAMYSMTEDQL